MKSPREIALEKCLEKTLKDLNKAWSINPDTLDNRTKECEVLNRAIGRIQRTLKNGGGK